VFTFGDIGSVDEDGYLFLSDRKIDMIISGGVNIYPAEIESLLITHPAVADVGVIGVPNDEFGEEVKAVVQLVDGHDPADVEPELRQLCRDRLAGYMVPRSSSDPSSSSGSRSRAAVVPTAPQGLSETESNT
jgi:long-chain acyl-CoA synthetase